MNFQVKSQDGMHVAEQMYEYCFPIVTLLSPLMTALDKPKEEEVQDV